MHDASAKCLVSERSWPSGEYNAVGITLIAQSNGENNFISGLTKPINCMKVQTSNLPFFTKYMVHVWYQSDAAVSTLSLQ